MKKSEKRIGESVALEGLGNKHMPFIWMKEEATTSCWFAKL